MSSTELLKRLAHIESLKSDGTRSRLKEAINNPRFWFIADFLGKENLTTQNTH